MAGVDEAGRGPLAGPVVASAVVFMNNQSFKFYISSFKNIKDSKKLSAKQREYFYKLLISHPGIWWGIGVVSEKVIDKINILEATKLAMERAVISLEKKLRNSSSRNSHDRGNSKTMKNSRNNKKNKKIRDRAGFLILDGNFKINSKIPQKSIIKADEKVFSCAAASILAKVTRDRMMLKYDKKYPHYGFKKHKGYPTRLHFLKIKKYGPCKIHRKSFSCG